MIDHLLHMSLSLRCAAAMILIMVFGALPARAAGGAGTIDYDRFYRENSRLGIRELVERAKQVRIREHYDSAAAYYSMVSSLYAEDLSPEEIRLCAVASANMGYIWLSWRMNAVEAYPWLVRARNLAERHNLPDVMTGVTSTLGEMYFDYNDYAKAGRFLRRTLADVMRQRNDRYLGMAVIDYAAVSLLTREGIPDAGLMRSVAAYVPDGASEPLAAAATELAGAMLRHASGDAAGAARMLAGAAPDFSGIPDAARYRIMYAMVRSRIMADAGMWSEAEQTLDQAVEVAESRKYYNLMEKCFAQRAALAERRGDLALRDSYRSRALDIRDSLFSIAGFDAVKDLEIADSLGGLERKLESERLNARRHREAALFMLGAGAILLALLIWLFVSRRRLKKAYSEIFKRNLELADRFAGTASEPPAAGLPEAYDLEKGRELLGRIREVMGASESIYNPKFSVEMLAAETGARAKSVSQAINVLAGKNFNTLLAEYRIREACRLLNDREVMKTMTIEGVGEKVGYRSRTNFSKVFKDVTGLTPSQFARESRMSGGSSGPKA